MAARVIAIDGAAGSGKSTLGRGLARALGLPYINTGLMYRALAAAALRAEVDPSEEEALLELTGQLRFTLRGADPAELTIEGFDERSLTSLEVESIVSSVASHPSVRRWMVERQRALGRSGAVMEGRDIATVVFPDAAAKIFLVAGREVRADRRAAERATAADDVAPSLQARDERDARTTPLEPAASADVIDTTGLGIEETLREALRIVRTRWPEAPR